MSIMVVLPIKVANQLRKKIRRFLKLRDEFLTKRGRETVHDFRVASRRVREALDYFQDDLPEEWYSVLKKEARRTTKALGGLREAEVNLELIESLHGNQKLHPLTAEILIHSMTHQHTSVHKAANKNVRRRKYSQFEKFLLRLRGSRTLTVPERPLLQKRWEDFSTFPLDETNDESLHQLRIHTKKFRYAVEIYNSLHKKSLGRYVNLIRSLQNLLGTIHDLYVLETRIREELEVWAHPELSLIPTVLNETADELHKEKISLCRKVPRLYDRVIQKAPQEWSGAFKKDTQMAVPDAIQPASVSASPDQDFETSSQLIH